MGARDPSTTGGPGALAILLAAYALFVEPILGRWWYARLKWEREKDPQALLRVYRLTLLVVLW
ncbi:MAG: hypothetical protein ACR2OB_04055 [Solirubrobacteraceae bacterium]